MGRDAINRNLKLLSKKKADWTSKGKERYFGDYPFLPNSQENQKVSVKVNLSELRKIIKTELVKILHK